VLAPPLNVARARDQERAVDQSRVASQNVRGDRSPSRVANHDEPSGLETLAEFADGSGEGVHIPGTVVVAGRLAALALRGVALRIGVAWPQDRSDDHVGVRGRDFGSEGVLIVWLVERCIAMKDDDEDRMGA
jgi:hypothetical protein